MTDYGIKEFSDFVSEKLKTLNYTQILVAPTAEDNANALLQLHTPLKSVNKTENGFPILSTFQLSVTCWNVNIENSMEMTSEVETILQSLNFVRISTNLAVYDNITQKYGIKVNFEVRYNALTNTFQSIK